jgi:hypothetical protein
LVARSFSEILKSEKYSLTEPDFIDPIVPKSTIAAPIIKTTFDHANIESAKDGETFHISNLWVLAFAAVFVLGVIAIIVSIQEAVRKTRKKP